jgi:hypothetical protein
MFSFLGRSVVWDWWSPDPPPPPRPPREVLPRVPRVLGPRGLRNRPRSMLWGWEGMDGCGRGVNVGIRKVGFRASNQMNVQL